MALRNQLAYYTKAKVARMKIQNLKSYFFPTRKKRKKYLHVDDIATGEGKQIRLREQSKIPLNYLRKEDLNVTHGTRMTQTYRPMTIVPYQN